MAVKSNGLMSGKANGCRTVLSVGSCVGKRIYIQSLHNSVLVRSRTDSDLHLMPRRGADHGFVAGIHNLGGTAGQPGHNGRINLAHRRLLRSKTASDGV